MAKILVAVEDAALAGVLEAELEGDGHCVVSAASGYDAYELALQERPEFVFLAAHLPVYDGLTTCEMVRSDPELGKDVPVVLIFTEEVDVKLLERAGVTAVLAAEHETWQVREILGKFLKEE